MSDELTQWQRQRDERQALLNTVQRNARDFSGDRGDHWNTKAEALRSEIATLDAKIDGTG